MSFLGIHHQQVFARDADEPVVQRRRQIRDAQGSAVVLGAQGLEGVVDVVKEALLELRQLERVRGELVGVAPQHFFAQVFDGVAHRVELRHQGRVVFLHLVQRRTEVAAQRVERGAQFLEIDRFEVRLSEAHGAKFLLDVAHQGQFARLVFTQEAGNGINAGNRRQVRKLLLERDGLLQGWWRSPLRTTRIWVSSR